MNRFSRSFVRVAFCAGALSLQQFASAAPTWTVQADFQSTTTRSLRGIALSPDGTHEYLGLIQGTSGTTAIREYSSSAISPPTNPATTAAVTLNGLQPK